MSTIKSIAWGSKKRKVIASLGILGLLAGGALAYFLLIVGASGTGTQTNGPGPSGSAITLSATWPDSTLAPGGSVPVSVSAHNGNSQTAAWDGSHLAANSTITTSNPGCNPTWFTFTIDAGSFVTMQSVGAGADVAYGPVGHIAFTDSGTDQSACEAPTSVTLHLAS